MSNSSPIQVASDCEEQASSLLDIESSSKKRPRVKDKYCSGSKKPRTTFNHVSAEDVVVETDLESNIRDLIEQLPFEGENLTEVREFVDFEEVAIGNIDYNNDEQEETFLKSIVAA
ncbi:845_t:CDS:1, partial [Paraglomus occultum]